MAILSTPGVNHPTYKSWTLTGDTSTTTTTFAHGFASTPDCVTFSSAAVQATTASVGVAITVSSTQITVACNAFAATGNVLGKVNAWLPHSIN